MSFICILVVLVVLSEVTAHGRLRDPPARSSAWREDQSRFPVDYNDNQMFCGGFYTQWTVHSYDRSLEAMFRLP